MLGGLEAAMSLVELLRDRTLDAEALRFNRQKVVGAATLHGATHNLQVTGHLLRPGGDTILFVATRSYTEDDADVRVNGAKVDGPDVDVEAGVGLAGPHVKVFVEWDESPGVDRRIGLKFIL